MQTLKQGSVGADVIKLQKGLATLGFFKAEPNQNFGPKTEQAVEDFQDANDLLSDGIFGKGSAAVYNKLVAPEFQFVEAPVADPSDIPPSDKRKWVSTKCHVAGGGFSSTTLRDDVAAAFAKMYAEVDALGGKLTSAGGKRPLSVGGGAAQSKTSLHYLGRAHDLSLGAAMQNPLVDPVVVVREDPNNRKWVIWFRTSNPAVPEITLPGILCKTVNKKAVTSVVPVTGRFFNFTELAAKYGFVPISGRRKFFDGTGSYTMAEWWHIQNEIGMLRGKTTFGEELLKVYSLAECQKFIFWNIAKNAVWGEDFN